MSSHGPAGFGCTDFRRAPLSVQACTDERARTAVCRCPGKVAAIGPSTDASTSGFDGNDDGRRSGCWYWGARRSSPCKIRARVEHVIGRMKNYKILRDCRQRGDGLHHAVQAVARMHNLALAA